MRFLLDTSCMVAIVNSLHVHHAAATAEYNDRLNRAETMVIAAHTLVEAYSVLTRSPSPIGVAPAHAAAVLDATFTTQGEVTSLDPSEYLALLGDASREVVTGGRIYDMVIAYCARKAQVDVLLTFNDRHFRQFERDGLKVRVPQVPTDPP